MQLLEVDRSVGERDRATQSGTNTGHQRDVLRARRDASPDRKQDDQQGVTTLDEEN